MALPENGKKISAFTAGTVTQNSYFVQAKNGATEKVSADEIADYVGTSATFSGLNTTSKTPVGAINELNAGKLTNDYTSLTSATPASNDIIAFSDTSDNGAVKSASVRDILGNIVSEKGTDKASYLFRALPFDANLKKMKLVGGSVAFNQLLQNGNFTTVWSVQGGTANGVSDNVFDVSFDGTSGAQQTFVNLGYTPTANHIYFSTVDAKLPNINCSVNLLGGKGAIIKRSISTTDWQTISSIWTGNTYKYYIVHNANKSVAIDHLLLRNAMFIDLTQMFGSTIADYIYTLEQTTAGAGVAFFRSLFPNDYYDYNTGELMSVKTSAHKTYDSNNVLIGEYPLASNLELRGIPKLDSNNKLYYDGDTYDSSGTVTRKYGIVDLGSLEWIKQNTQSSYMFRSTGTSATAKRPSVNTVITNIICAEYPTTSATLTYTMVSGVGIAIDANGDVNVYDTSYSDKDAFKTAMSGVYLIYELATPTTETADRFNTPQAIEAGGTEQFVDSRSVPIPVGQESTYYDVISILRELFV